MKSSIAAIATALLIATLIASPFGVFISAFLGAYDWTMASILTMFGAVGIVVIASKIMDRKEATA
jgi:hypothetical protein